MAIRILHLRSRHPVVAAAIALGVVAVVLAVLAFGLALLAGLAVVGGAVVLVRRALGLGGRRTPPLRPLDPAAEVFAPAERERRPALPPAADPDRG